MVICDKDLCTGCGTCYNACPCNAILMVADKEGFLYPIIDEVKCSNCGVCKEICPILATERNLNSPNPECFAFSACDELRAESASGGAFPAIAEVILNEGGYVCGAAFDENMTVRHTIINNKDDLQKLKNSKYVQSDVGQCYAEIKILLNSDKKVLFSGTPCQVAGLQSFLSQNYENLFTIDLICHGTPSDKVFKKYLEEKTIDGEKVLNVNFRDKINGWSNYLTTTTTTTVPALTDSYMKAFLANLSLRKSCGNCKFNSLPRSGDLTIGDFWGIEKFNKKTR